MPPVILFILIVILLSIAIQLRKILKDSLTIDTSFELVRHDNSQSGSDSSAPQDATSYRHHAEDGLNLKVDDTKPVNWEVFWINRLLTVIAVLIVCLIIKLVFSIS